jgi:hypothetical protein
MSSVAYAIRPSDVIMDGQETGLLWLHDIPKDPEELRLRALVASGDYFEMLAAQLEQIAATMPLEGIEQHQLQSIVGQLLYLQRNYVIAKK